MFPKTLFGFCRSIFKKYAPYFCVTFILGLAAYLLDTVLYPYVFKWIVQVFEIATTGVLSHKIYLIFGIYVAVFAIDRVSNYIRAHWRPIIGRTLTTDLYNGLYENDIDFFINRPSGQIMRQIGVMESEVQKFIEKYPLAFIRYTLGIIIISVGIYNTNWRFGLFIMGIAVVRAVWRFLVQKKINVAIKKLQNVRSKLNGIRSDSVGNAITVKLFGNVKYENDYIYSRFDDCIAQDHHVSYLRRIQIIPASALWWILSGGIILWSVYMIMHGQMTIADGTFIFVGGRSISGAFTSLMNELSDYSESRAAATNAFDEMFVPRTIVDAPDAKKLKSGANTIDFDNVSFNYGKGDVIKNFTLNIGKNERVGIVGISGAGKTTLVNLMLRAYDVKNGAIKIGGINVRDVTTESLRKNIAFVPQDALLFNRSLLENIRYGRPNASRRDVIDAARRANIHDFIASLPDGYDTLVGNNGIKLSGGQRQRIAIARAILKNASILILDEATSALDSKNEMLIQSALRKVMRNRTTIVIAHRLSTLRNMDRIVVIGRGQILESGTHSQLLRAGGAYRKLWNMQTGGFIS